MVNKDVYSRSSYSHKRSTLLWTNGLSFSLPLNTHILLYRHLNLASPQLRFLLLLLLSLGNDILIGGINVIIASRDSGSLRISQPRVLARALPTRLHVPGIGDIANLMRQCTLIRNVAGLRRCGCYTLAVPRLNCGQLVQRLGLGDPRQGLCHCHVVNVGPKEL